VLVSLPYLIVNRLLPLLVPTLSGYKYGPSILKKEANRCLWKMKPSTKSQCLTPENTEIIPLSYINSRISPSFSNLGPPIIFAKVFPIFLTSETEYFLLPEGDKPIRKNPRHLSAIYVFGHQFWEVSRRSAYDIAYRYDNFQT